MASKSSLNTKRSTCIATCRSGEEAPKKFEEEKTSCVKVVVRVRPLNEAELAKGAKQCVRPMDDHVLVFDPDEASESVGFLPNTTRNGRKRKHRVLERRARDLRFIFDRVLDKNASNQELFEHTTQSITDGVLNGYNCTVFAYGATGAGKTFTMLGTPQSPGVVFQTMMDLYRRIQECRDEKTCDVAVSYLEVYNETIRDLLIPGKPLAVREDPKKGVCVSSLSLHKPQSAEELLGMLEYGNSNRTQHPTDANAQSSRSHAVFQTFVRQKDRTAGLQADVRLAKMSLIDLAGSERATVTTNRGARFREGANINKSLLALGNCINALADKENKSGHIPYRDSKLTRLLKDSLGGNCRTVMIAAVSPSSLSYEDTYNTLKYADRAKSIKSKLSRNVVSVDFHVHRYAKIVEDLRAEICELKSKISCQQMQPVGIPPQGHMEVHRLCSALKSVINERAAVTKDLADIEASEQELIVKLHRKEQNVERLHLLGINGEILEKARNKVQKFLSNKKSKERHLSERKNQVEDRLKSNSEWLERIRTQMKLLPENTTESELMDLHYKKSIAELESGQLRRKCQHFKKYANLQEKDVLNIDSLVVKLLSVAQKQFQLLKAAGLATPDLCEDYQSAASVIVEDQEVSWADQSTRSNEYMKFSTMLCHNTDQLLTGTPKKTPIRVRGFNTPLPAELDMTPSRIPVAPKPTFDMMPNRTLASPENQLIQEPVRLVTPTQPQINMSPVRVLRSNCQPFPVGQTAENTFLIRSATPGPTMRDARMSLNKEFEAVESPTNKTSISKQEHNDNDSHSVSISKKLLGKNNFTTSEQSNTAESVSTFSVMEYSSCEFVDTLQKDKQNSGSKRVLSEQILQFCAGKTSDPTSTCHSHDNCQQPANKGNVKPRFLTPYPKGALLPSTDKNEIKESVDSPEISNRSTNSFDLSGVNLMPGTPTTLAIKPPSFFQSASAKNKFKGIGTPLRELPVSTQKNIQTLHSHGLPSMFDDPNALEKKGITKSKNLPKRVEIKRDTDRRPKGLKRTTSSTCVSGGPEKKRRPTSELRRANSSGSLKLSAPTTFTTCSVSKPNPKTTRSQKPRWQ